jgi:hypothetical protein
MNKKIILPETINDINLGQFQKFMKLSQKADELDAYNFLCRKIEIFTGLIRSEVDSIKQVDLEEINNQIDKALNSEGTFKQTFQMYGIDFGLIPNFDKIKSKEFFDLSTYGVEVETLHNSMAILYRPIKSKGINNTYELFDYQGTDEWANRMKLMPLSYVNGALGFFLTLQKDLKNYFQKYMELELVKDK